MFLPDLGDDVLGVLGALQQQLGRDVREGDAAVGQADGPHLKGGVREEEKERENEEREEKRTAVLTTLWWSLTMRE